MSRPQLDVNFFDRSAVEDPFPLYESIRATGRVVWNDLLRGWMVTGYQDCWEVLTDNGDRFAAMGGDPATLPWFEAPTMISIDGEVHNRLRSCMVPLFTRRAVAHLEDRINDVVDQLLAPLPAGDEGFDLIADFTMVPTIVVAEMLGVPPERHGDFRRWSNTIVSNLAWGHEDPAARAVLGEASTELNAYLREEIERHRRDRPDDLLTAMLRASDEGAMDGEEVRSAAVLLLIAGYDTTAKLLSNTLVALEANPDQRALVVDDPTLVPAAIEEVLRWRGTVQMIPRQAVAEATLAGTAIGAGDVVYTMIGAAGRDPARWDDPQRFDVRRPPKTNMGFGFGPHLCLGMPLARLESKVAIERLLRIAPDFRLRGIDYGPSVFVRGPERGFLDVTVRA